MEQLESNLKAILLKRGESLENFLTSFNVTKTSDLSLGTLQNLCSEEGIQLENLITYSLNYDKEKLKRIKFVILDVDGVMTDGGMYYTQKGDEIKKYNTKDGMGIMEARKFGVDFGIISSGFKMEIVKARADLLNIEYFYVGREPKMNILKNWCERLDIDLNEVAIIGDDINDLELIRNVGFSAAPANAIPIVKKNVDLVLKTKGGEGCVREFLDYYLLDNPLVR